jgi:MFS family permease
MGPPLGGLIVTYASWRWIFFINIPIDLVVYARVAEPEANIFTPERQKRLLHRAIRF